MRLLSLAYLALAAVVHIESVDAAYCTPLPAPAPRYHCGQVGDLKNPKPLPAISTAQTTDECAAQCYSTNGCISFGFNRDNRGCTLYQARLTAMGIYSNPATNVIFYNIHCYACTPCSPPTTTETEIITEYVTTPTPNTIAPCTTPVGKLMKRDDLKKTKISSTSCPTFSTTVTSTTTTTSTSTVYDSALIYLPSPTQITGTGYYDDQFFDLELPFPVQIYNVATSNVSLSINGFIVLLGTFLYPNNSGSGNSYGNLPLPDYPDPNKGVEYLPDTTICAYWADLLVGSGGLYQGLYYQVDGIEPNRNLSIEFYTVRNDGYGSNVEHFLTSFSENAPGFYIVTYLQSSYQGNSATVGLQSAEDQDYAQYEYNQAVITNGLVLGFDPATNSLVQLAPATCPT